MTTRRSSQRLSIPVGNAAPMTTLPSQTARPAKITPRNSIADEALGTAAIETPYETLRQLASIVPKPTTPVRRASSAGPPSTHRSSRRTPAVKTPGVTSRHNSAKKPAAATPYGQAARRGLDERRTAALTPGRNRRHSIKQQKDTPRDVLRLLSKVLAPGTAAIPSSSPGAPPAALGRLGTKGPDDSLDDFELRPPRLSLPLGDDDDGPLIAPQRTPIRDEEDYIQFSLERSRRAYSEQPGKRGTTRLSDAFGFGLDAGGVFDGNESSVIGPGTFDDDFPLPDNDPTIPGDFTGNIRQSFDLDPFGRPSLSSDRIGEDLLLNLHQDDTERSFALTVPRRDSLESRLDGLEPSKEADTVDDESLDENINEFEQLEEEPEDVSMINPTIENSIHEPQEVRRGGRKTKKIKTIKLSKHGICYPSLPLGVVKKLAISFMRTGGDGKAKLSKDTLEAILQASDWFFEQVSEDLGTYAAHAGRKTIDESDVLTLLKRQRQTNASTTPFALAQRHLPRELLQDLRMVPPSKPKKSRNLERIEEADEE